MQKYNHKKFEKKWQEKWAKKDLYRAEDFSKKPKFYCLIEFPYPSGAGLHVGHLRSYSALDCIARKKRMQGYNVLYPIGWDAFGLPTENYAIKTKQHPAKVTKKNIATFTKQIKSAGISFDWSREINTTDPKYYKWTQWIFLQLFKKGLAYQDEIAINWCGSCKIGLANEEVVAGKCERCGAKAVKKMQKQWMLKITKYAEKLLKYLKTVDYLPKIRIQQENWIGKSEGAEIVFPVVIARSEATKQSRDSQSNNLKVFTTRPDTIFGATYMVVCPEHKIIKNQKSEIRNQKEVFDYIASSSKKSDLDRTDLAKEKTGIEIKGIKAINPANKKEISIWIADYVLPHYGTGAIMAVPGHDRRDYDFAKKYKITIKEVVSPKIKIFKNNSLILETNNIDIVNKKIDELKGCQVEGINAQVLENYMSGIKVYSETGILKNSGKFNGMDSEKAITEITKWLSEKGMAKKAVNYKLRDWIFSRQHYWGEPIPIVHCGKCGAVPVPADALPIKLPNVKKYEPTDTGESPLAKIKDWVNTKCPKCKGPAKRETDTMPNWAGSSWYFLRYIDPKNNKKFADFKKLKYWLPIDLYNGGMEHTTLHLLYSRFWHKFLYDIGAVPTKEPYAKRISHGMVLAEDGKKMSKSLGNVINPDDIISKYGADTLRMYEMFMGPFSEAIPWSTQGMIGVKRFLHKVWNLFSKAQKQAIECTSCNKLLHKTIKKTTKDIDNFRFNTAISQLMILVNAMQKKKNITIANYELLLTLLSPFAPHITEELWLKIGHKKSIHLEKWPEYDEKLIKEDEIELLVQINGKLRDKIKVLADITEQDAKEKALKSEKIKKHIKDQKIKKAIFIKNKLINFVV